MPSFVGVSGFSASCALRGERGGGQRGIEATWMGNRRSRMDVCFFCVCFFVGFVSTVITVYTIRFVLLDAYCVDGSGDGDRVGEGAEPVGKGST